MELTGRQVLFNDHRSHHHRPATLNATLPLIVSQRGSASFAVDSNGHAHAMDAAGGLAATMRAIAPHRRLRWVCTTIDEGDRAAARDRERWQVGNSEVQMVEVPRAAQALHASFANPLLWLLQHGLAARMAGGQLPADLMQGWREGYRVVNAMVADHIARSEPDAEPVILIQDYHFYLLPRLIRRHHPDALITQFVHLPWPEPEAWSALPRTIVMEILHGLLAANVVGFPSAKDAARFGETCARYLGDAPVGSPDHGSHVPLPATVRIYPVPVDVSHLRALASGPEVVAYREGLTAPSHIRTIARVDPLDPARNIAAGFRAYGLLLEREPELRGRVRFVAHLVPAGCGVAEYEREAREVFAAAAAVNLRFGSADWQPIELVYAENRARALALLSISDVLLVNPLSDGMSLAAKESAALNRRGGALVLSRGAGAWEQLQRWAIGVDPSDVAGTATALHEALALPWRERWTRAEGLRSHVERSSVEAWLADQIADLEAQRQSQHTLRRA
jgi:trehalose 6-phosphate synthase